MISDPTPTASHNVPDAVISASQASATARSSIVVVILIFAAGISLRLIHCFGSVEMWYDELAVVRNVHDRNLVELVSRPLDHRQVTPVGFLSYLKLACELFGYSDIGVRVGPTLLSLLNVFLFWRVIRRFTDGLSLYAPLMVFAISPGMIMYGGSPKQYVCDVTASLLLILVSLMYLEQPGNVRRGVIAGIIGGLAMLASFPAVPIASILGVILVMSWWRNRETVPALPLICQGTCWLVGIAIAGLVATNLLDPTVDDFMQEFWSDAFPPHSPPYAAVTWSLTTTYGNYVYSLFKSSPTYPPAIPIAGLPAALALVGLVCSWRERDWRAYFMLVPMMAGLAAAFVHLLPFAGRLGIYVGWPVLVLAGVGLDRLRHSLTGRLRYTGPVVAVLMVLPLAVAMSIMGRPPYRLPVHSIDVLTELGDRLQPGDRIYVYTQGRHAIAFYGVREGIQQWTQGERHTDDPSGFLREVDVMRGEPRVWFFWSRLRGDQPGFIRGYLETIGEERERIPEDLSWNSGAVLYDLSDPAKLNQASADTFPVGDL